LAARQERVEPSLTDTEVWREDDWIPFVEKRVGRIDKAIEVSATDPKIETQGIGGSRKERETEDKQYCQRSGWR
jgi:hypothetical protein